ncbi:hypothetical protein ABIE52_003711 [Rhodococcus sp. OAS809]
MIWLRVILILAMVAMIAWTLLEFSTRPTRKPLTEADVYEAMTGRKQRSKAKFLATDQFEAWTHCPSCGEFDCHAMREPLPWDPADWRTWSQGRAEYLELHQSATTIEAWGGHAYRWIDSTPEYPIAEPVNETRFATIRICKCGREWGQK